MFDHDIESGCKETNDVIRFSDITDADDFSFILATVGVVRDISCGGGWLGIALVLQHTDAGGTSVGGVVIPFGYE